MVQLNCDWHGNNVFPIYILENSLTESSQHILLSSFTKSESKSVQLWLIHGTDLDFTIKLLESITCLKFLILYIC